MKNFLFFLKDKNRKSLKKGYWVFLIFVIAFSFSFLQIQEVKAQNVDPVAATQRTTETIRKTFWEKLGVALKKAGSIAFNRTLQSSLNKIAYDAANYIGAGGDGQKPLFRTEGIGDYMKKIGDQAGGQFLETFVRNLDTSNATSTISCEKRLENCLNDCYYQANGHSPSDPKSLKRFREDSQIEYVGAGGLDAMGEVVGAGYSCVKQCELGNTSCVSGSANKNKLGTSSNLNSFNVCQPSSIEVKLKISLGLVAQNRPTGPNCTATTIISNWGDDISKKLDALDDPNWLQAVDSIFDPRANDLGIYFLARADLSAQSQYEKDIALLEDTKTGGWIDVKNIAGEIKGTPDAAKKAEADARAIRIANFGKTTGDIFVDAANLFLNQLAVSAYNNLMRKLADKKADAGPALVDAAADPNFSGVSSMREKTRVLIEPNFESKSDYSVLSELAICPDPGNPGPNNCVIDDRFMQAIIEQKTVGEAIEEGYLNSNWKIEKDVFASAYNSHYSLRNVKILRKYRIVPLAWEVAIEKAFSDETNPRQVTFGDLVACFSESDKFDKFSANFKSSDITWCQGLVDPNWVLKAPLNYCGQSGSGAHILNMTMVPSSSGEEELIITRSDDYCADNQSCIKENKEGGCDLYGYCTEDRRTWDFTSNSCSPINNTCQTFVNTSNQESASYLENTIDYGDCNADSAGCRRYSLFGNYNDNNSISWNLSNNLFFNKNLVSCNAQNEGCSELMRIKSTWGFNLVTDSAFNFFGLEQVGANIGPWRLLAGASAQIIDTNNEVPDFTDNSRAMKISGSNGAGFESSAEVFPENLQILANQNYTLSADIYLFSGDRVQMYLNPGDKQVSSVVNQSGYWQRISVTLNASSGFYEPKFSFAGFGASVDFYVKNIKLEVSDLETNYNSYGSYISRTGNLLTAHFSQKLLPTYLHETCYVDAVSASKNYTLKSDAPAICSNYARQCNQDEVGCELFTNTYDNFSTPAQVSNTDYCAGECVGYDVYIAKETYFNPIEAQNLIPTSATKCIQSAVGCNEFTNLDAISQGGEGKEYYSELKQCIKPNSAQCANFYTWESSASGYQIKTYSLQKDTNNNPLASGNQATADCSAIFGLPISDPRYNPDCREFRNTSGQVSYRLISRVITCSDNCFNYRLNANNLHPTAKTEVDCNSSGDETYWNSQNATCLTCLNGGKWDTSQNACVYQGIPGEGKSCQAAQAGCREYNGNRGNDVQLLASYDFESGLSGWYSNCSAGVEVSPIANSQKGSSLFYNSAASSCEPAGEKVAKVKLGSAIKAGHAYSLKFLARSTEANTLKIYFESVNGDKYFFNLSSITETEAAVTIKGGNEWAIYQVNLENVAETLDFDGTLNFSASSDFYLDEVILNEISNRYYFIKNSIKIPDVCYYDNAGKYQGADYNLGCAQYKDKDNYSHNLHNFTKLCSSSSIGCEQMISTNNYSSPQARSWDVSNLDQSCEPGDENCLTVERDKAMYVVYDKSKSCLNSDIGCSRMGEGLGSGYDISWSDVFKLNNPNSYDKSLCAEGDLGCEEYRGLNSGGLSYFRNPANNLCVYRSSSNPEITGKAWYKAPVKRCDLDKSGSIDKLEVGGTICSKDGDCSTGTCIVDNNDYSCSVSYLKTIGYGGLGTAIPAPDNAVGLCEPAASGCTEYIDPISKFNPNLVKNPGYVYVNDNRQGWGEDTWPQIGGTLRVGAFQVISLERNKLYSLRATNKNNGSVANGVRLEFIGDVRILGEETIDGVKQIGTSNNFGDVTKSLVTSSSTYPYIIFNSLSNYSALLGGGHEDITIEIKEIAIDYNIKEEVDSSSCNGLVNFDAGCVLFNERSIAGASGLELNKFNALAGDGVPINSYGPYNANKLLKVKPDRTCASWLACTSYALNSDGSKSCSSVAECNLLDDKNECLNFIVRPEAENIIFDAEKNRNATGYALNGNYYFNNIKEVGLNTSVRYDFEDDIPPLSCIQADSSGNPIIGDTSFCSFDENIIKDSLIRKPGLISYPAKGKSYLKVSPFQAISPHAAGSYIVLPEAGDYYLSYLLNTQNSDTAARVSIENVSNRSIMHDMDQIEQAPNGWERKVHKIKTENDNIHIRIYLSLLATGSSGPIYFDDINIETVLKVADNDYRTRDCRLYPTSSSFNCQEVDNAVVRNGLEGYCLEYDLADSSVCQLWMPIDRIASTQINSNQLGYGGKYPLNYCAEVSSNFIFLEKRMAATVKEENLRRDNDKWLGARTCYYPEDGAYCTANFSTGSTTIYIQQTGGFGSVSSSGDYDANTTTILVYDPETGELIEEKVTVDSTGVQYLEITEREPTDLSGVEEWGACVTNDGRDGIKLDNQCVDHYILDEKVEDVPNRLQTVLENCGSTNYFLLVASDLRQENSGFLSLKRDDIAVTSICMPLQSGSPSTFKYVAVSSEPIKTYDGVKTIRPLTDGWYLADGFHSADGQAGDKRDGTPSGFDELYNSDPPLRVLDQNYPTPTGESDLKKISSRDPDEVFRLTCNKFIEAVSGSGDNMAWSSRLALGSDYAISTPPETGIEYNNYIRKIGDIPFGAASWPTDFSLSGSERVPLYNQYSVKNKDDVFAGRPYGCEVNGSSDINGIVNCSRIGYCSANPDVYCLLDSGWSNKGTTIETSIKYFTANTYDIARHSCGSFGTCQPLWTFNTANAVNFANATNGALGQLFVQAPVAYEFKDNAGGYVSTLGYYNPIDTEITDEPEIKNLKIFRADTSVQLNVGSTIKAGNYRLEFNSTIDPNRQPLKEIFIDWGDGFKQVIIGEDSKSSSSGTQHVFYHFYPNNRNSTDIKVRVYDNWGASSPEITLTR
ncbi:hypothetical protein GW758_03930 [Candidatus Falkowbacteria bacterium]|nr:hypothetical protein [Candidatus Falkowbacteria bacterium]